MELGKTRSEKAKDLKGKGLRTGKETNGGGILCFIVLILVPKIAYYIKKKSALGCGLIIQLIIGAAWQGPNTTQNKVQQQRQINFKLEYMESVKPVCQIADGSVPVAIHSYRTHIKDEKTLRTRNGLGRILSNKTVAKCQLWMLRGAAESLFPSPPHGGARCLLISPELQDLRSPAAFSQGLLVDWAVMGLGGCSFPSQWPPPRC